MPSNRYRFDPHIGSASQISRDDETISNDLAVSEDLAVTGDATVGDDLAVTGDLTVTETITFSDSLLHSAQMTQTLAVDTTLDITHCGKVIQIATDAKVLTLPSTAAGLNYTIMNTGADGAVLVTISPAAADKISGVGLTAADDKDLLNTKATAKHGDMVRLIGDGVDGWVVAEMRGTWAREG